MPYIQSGGASIHYLEVGTGYPMLLLAPGGLNSSIARWESATINPLVEFIDDYHLIAMDQRNAGDSRAPFPVDNPWETYLRDQCELMDALGYTRFHLLGCCIGCSFALKLALACPDRVSAVVLEQPMGLIPENHQGWRDRCHSWVREVAAERPDLDESIGHRSVEEMWSQDFVASLTRSEVATIYVPTCVLPGIDEIHPTAVGFEIAELISGATTISPWKYSAEHARDATRKIREFLVAHTP